MKVLVGIITINRAKIIPKAIQSAYNQSLKDLKVAVFDDGSTDNTKNLVNVFKEVEWHFPEERKGYIYGRNKLMSETSAEYYCSLDDDSWFIKGDELEIAINYLDNNPDVACIAFDILSPDKPDKKEIDEPEEAGLFVGCGHVLRLSVVRDIGYYFQFPGFYGGEEKDLCLQIINKGFKIIKLPGVYVWHDNSATSRSHPPKIWTSLVCNDLSLAYMRFPLFKMLVGIPYKILIQFRYGFKHNMILATIKGICKFLFNLIGLRLKRRSVSTYAFNKFQNLTRR